MHRANTKRSGSLPASLARMLVRAPPSHRRPASAPAGRVTFRSAAKRPCSAAGTAASPQPSQIDAAWRSAVVRAEQLDQKLRQDAQARSAGRERAHMIEMRVQSARAAERTKQQKISAAHRAWHEQLWLRHEEQLQARETTAAAARLQRSHRRHKAVQQWRSEHTTRTQQMAPGSCHFKYSTAPRPTLSGPSNTPEDNQREASMRAKIDGAQSALAKERFALAQLPHETTLAAHKARYQRVRAIKGTVAAKELCDRHQIDKERQLVFSQGRSSLQLTMRTTLGLELTQKSRARQA